MRRVKLTLAVAAVMVAMLAVGQTPAMADDFGNGFCSNGIFFNNLCSVSQPTSQQSTNGTVNLSFNVTQTP